MEERIKLSKKGMLHTKGERGSRERDTVTFFSLRMYASDRAQSPRKGQ